MDSPVTGAVAYGPLEMERTGSLSGLHIFLAIGEVLHTARRSATAEARPVGEDDGELYAHGTTTCLKFPLSVVS